MVAPPKTTFPTGTVLLDRYELGTLLGSGGMGDVYGALDRESDTKVAIKVLKMKKHLMSDGAVVRFEREAKATAGLGHPNIIQVMDFHRTEKGTPFLVMEFLVGESLGERLEEIGKLPVDEAVDVHIQVLRGLKEAHSAGVVHRDIKPDNTFLVSGDDRETSVKVLDFGLAYLLENKGNTKLTKTGMAIGTPSYMAPERLRGELATNRSDIYSVGVSLFQCITGALPFPGKDLRERLRKALHEEPPKVTELDPEVDPTLSSIIDAALAKQIDSRFATAEEFMDLLLRWREDPESVGPDDLPKSRSLRPTADNVSTVQLQAHSANPPPKPGTEPPPPSPLLDPNSGEKKRSPTFALGIIAVVLGCVGVLWWSLQSDLESEPREPSSAQLPEASLDDPEPLQPETDSELRQATEPEAQHPNPQLPNEQAARPATMRQPIMRAPAADPTEEPQEQTPRISGALQEPEW